MKIGIIGVGMVGTPIKRFFEELKGYKRGGDIFLYDANPQKEFQDDIGLADIIFICVPTPRAQEGSADLSALESAFSRISGEKIVVIKSTVPPGTTEKFQAHYPQHKILFNPEFLTEKQAWEDFIRPDRQIVGFTEKSIDAAHLVLSLLPKAPFMSPWGMGTYQSIKITATEAEIIKYGGNVFFARKVNFANVLAALAEVSGVEYKNIQLGLAADHRIGSSHLDVGHGGYRGFGGYCLPKDVEAFCAHLRVSNLVHCAELLEKDFSFNKALLESQGISLEDVSVHVRDHKQKEV